jgi:hypothetical protein
MKVLLQIINNYDKEYLGEFWGGAANNIETFLIFYEKDKFNKNDF